MIVDKVDFRVKNAARDKEGYPYKDKGASLFRGCKYSKQLCM